MLANGLYGADVGPYSIADSIVRDLELAGIVDSKATYAKHVRDARFELAEATDRARLRATKANAIDLKSAA